MQLVKPPIGVMPLKLWQSAHPEPTVGQLFFRYIAVMAAVDRYRAAKKTVPAVWLAELGVG